MRYVTTEPYRHEWREGSALRVREYGAGEAIDAETFSPAALANMLRRGRLVVSELEDEPETGGEANDDEGGPGYQAHDGVAAVAIQEAKPKPFTKKRGRR